MSKDSFLCSSSSCKMSKLSMFLLTYVLLLLRGAASNPINTPLTRTEMEDLFRAYAPYLYLHPDEGYLPSSVNWFFSNGALLYKKGEESKPLQIEPDGANLPKGDDPDGSYWIDLPADKGSRDRVSHGDIASAEAYVHFKPGVENGTFTDIQARADTEIINYMGHFIIKLHKIDIIFKKITKGKNNKIVSFVSAYVFRCVGGTTKDVTNKFFLSNI